MEYKILNAVYEKNYNIYINGYTSLDEFHFIEKTQIQELEIIIATYENVLDEKDKIETPIFKIYEDNIFRFIENNIQTGKYKTQSDNKILLDTMMSGCIIQLKVPKYYKYNLRTKRFDIRTDEYSLFAYELEKIEVHSDIDGKLQRIVKPHLI